MNSSLGNGAHKTKLRGCMSAVLLVFFVVILIVGIWFGKVTLNAREVMLLLYDTVDTINSHQMPVLAPEISTSDLDEIRKLTVSGMGNILEANDSDGEFKAGVFHYIVRCETGRYHVSIDDSARFLEPFNRQRPVVQFVRRVPD